MIGSSAQSMAMANAVAPECCPEHAPPAMEDRFGSRPFERFL